MKEASAKTETELVAAVGGLRSELAKMQVERSTSQQKNTNIISNKKKQLAVFLTALRSKKNT